MIVRSINSSLSYFFIHQTWLTTWLTYEKIVLHDLGGVHEPPQRNWLSSCIAPLIWRTLKPHTPASVSNISSAVANHVPNTPPTHTQIFIFQLAMQLVPPDVACYVKSSKSYFLHYKTHQINKLHSSLHSLHLITLVHCQSLRNILIIYRLKANRVYRKNG